MCNNDKLTSIINSLEKIDLDLHGFKNCPILETALLKLNNITNELSLYNFNNVDDKKTNAKATASCCIDTVKNKLTQLGASNDTRNQYLYPLNEIVKEIDKQNTISDIVSIQKDFYELYEESCEKIDDANNLNGVEVNAEEYLDELETQKYIDLLRHLENEILKIKKCREATTKSYSNIEDTEWDW